MASKSVAIGIDLGTTYSCVALFKNGQVEVIANEHGNRTTPSYVAFTDSERLVGEAAKNQAGTNPANTVFDTKRLIGRKFCDAVVQEDMLNWPFKVVNKEGKPHIKVTYKNEEQLFMPEQISSMILEKMKQTAVTYHGSEIKKAVVTVPAYFNDAQRQATKAAAKIAGLDILRIVNEPTAAGIAYGFRSQYKSKKNVLVFDFGGGTFDVSILTIDDGIYEVKSTAGDTHLGGEDCDTNLVNHFLKEIQRKYNKDLTDNKKAIYRLRLACEKMKRNLTTNSLAQISVDSLFDGQDFMSSISKAMFDEINKKIYEKLKLPITKALEDADMEPKQIDSIVSVGGSSKITYVNNIIADVFHGKQMERDINVDEAVGIGAAILAAHLNGEEHESLKNFHLRDVTPLSLGIEVVGGQMEVLIERNTVTPASQTKTFTTNFEDQSAVSIVVYEGERPLVKDNNKLGEFIINGILPAPREVPKIEVTFAIDKDGILKVSGVDKRNEESQKEMTIENDSGRLSEPEIRRLIQDAVKFREDDEKEQLRVRTKLELEDYCLDAKSKIVRAKGKITQKETETILKYCDECLEWLQDNEAENKESLMSKLKSLQSTCDRILAKC